MAPSDCSGTRLALFLSKRLVKDRTKTTRRRAETLLHKQASKRPMSPAKAGLLFSDCNPIALRAVYMRMSPVRKVAAMKIATSISAALVLVAAWAASPLSSAADGRSISKVNGSVRAAAGESYDKVSAVNGNVRVESGATVDEAETVNGEIVIENDAKVGAASTVNGSLDIGQGVAVAREAST